MLTSLHVEHFRGLQAVSLGDFGRINILVGHNGSGKTALLEALSLVTALNPTDLIAFANNRAMPSPKLGDDESLGLAFYLADTSQPIQFEFVINEVEHYLTIEPLSNNAPQQWHTPNANGSDEFNLRGLQYDYHSNGSEPIQQQLALTSERDKPLVKFASIPDKLGSFYIHGRRLTSNSTVARVLTKLAESEQDERLYVQAVQNFEPRVRRIRPGIRGNGRPVVLVDIGFERALPMNVLGDGFCRLNFILATIIDKNSRVVIVDEVDSGLHHAAMEGFWNGINLLTEKFERQFFCATHNEEMLKTALSAFQHDPTALRVFRVDRLEDNSVNVVKFDYADVKDSYEFGLDVR